MVVYEARPHLLFIKDKGSSGWSNYAEIPLTLATIEIVQQDHLQYVTNKKLKLFRDEKRM